MIRVTPEGKYIAVSGTKLYIMIDRGKSRIVDLNLEIKDFVVLGDMIYTLDYNGVVRKYPMDTMQVIKEF